MIDFPLPFLDPLDCEQSSDLVLGSARSRERRACGNLRVSRVSQDGLRKKRDCLYSTDPFLHLKPEKGTPFERSRTVDGEIITQTLEIRLRAVSLFLQI